MTWRELYNLTTPPERAVILAFLLQRLESNALRVRLVSPVIAYMETPSKVRFMFPLLLIQGISLAIGLGLGSVLGLIIILAVNLALVGVVALHGSARSQPLSTET